MAEHRSPKPGVAGSIPVSPANANPAAKLLKIVLTGEPGSGKTTVVRKVLERLSGRIPMTGFFTEEIRMSGKRVGFQGVTLDGRKFPLAHVDTKGPLRVGPYGVDLTGLESIGVSSLSPMSPGELVVIDEIGKMECLSEAFKARAAELLSSDAPLFATVAAVGVGFVKRVRNDRRARHFTVTQGQAEGMAGQLTRDILAWSDDTAWRAS